VHSSEAVDLGSTASFLTTVYGKGRSHVTGCGVIEEALEIQIRNLISAAKTN